MWSPDQIVQGLKDELRQEALLAGLERQRFKRVKRLWWRISGKFPSRRGAILAAVTVALLGGWAAVMIVHWPPGGGSETSDLVFTQGASLIFVVILLSLFNGPLAAGQRLGWDGGWVGRDARTWLGLLVVASISILLIWLGWVQPERPEEGASIMLTAAGLCVTALTAGRLIYLSDPGDQLDARLKAQLPHLLRLIKKRSAASEKAFKKAGSAPVWRELSLYAGVEVQRPMAGIVRQYALAAHRCAHDGDWTLAIRAHAANVRLVTAYVGAVGALQQEDLVVVRFAEETDALHEIAGGPDARSFSRYLVEGMKEVGLAVAKRQLLASQKQVFTAGFDSGPLSTVVYRTQSMFKRRVQDPQSADPAMAVQVLGELAAAAVQIGDDWMAVGFLKFLLTWAPATTNGGVVHLVRPLWEQSLRVLAALALQPTDDQAFGAAGDDFSEAFDHVKRLPTMINFSGFEPIVGAVVGPGTISLPSASYIIWGSDKVAVSDLSDWAWRTAHSMVRLLRRTEEADAQADPRRTGRDPQQSAEVIHHLVLAAAERAERDESARSEIEDLFGRLLETQRSAATGGSSSRGERGGAWHRYVSDAIVALYVGRRAEKPPSWLLGEVDGLRKAVSENGDDQQPVMMRGGIEWIATAVGRFGDAASEVAELDALGASVREDGRRRRWGPGLLNGRFHLEHGYVAAPILQDAEEWLFAEAGDDDDADVDDL